MIEQKTASLRPIWQIIDIVGKLAVAVALGYLTWTLSAAQHNLAARQAELQRQEIEANRDLKLLDIFYREITSGDPTRKRLAYAIVETYASPTLIQALATVAPELAVISAVKVSGNQMLSNRTRSDAARIRYELTNKLEILHPFDGDAVDMVIPVRARTPFSQALHHYIVVTPLKTGTDFVQTEPALHDGLLEGQARLGAAGVGGGEKFSIRIVATKSMLSPGTLLTVPDDAISSNSITVTRKN